MNSELGLWFVGDDVRLIAQNQWNKVFAYYATAAPLAWLLVRDGHAPTRPPGPPAIALGAGHGIALRRRRGASPAARDA